MFTVEISSGGKRDSRRISCSSENFHFYLVMEFLVSTTVVEIPAETGNSTTVVETPLQISSGYNESMRAHAKMGGFPSLEDPGQILFLLPRSAPRVVLRNRSDGTTSHLVAI